MQCLNVVDMLCMQLVCTVYETYAVFIQFSHAVYACEESHLLPVKVQRKPELAVAATSTGRHVGQGADTAVDRGACRILGGNASTLIHAGE